MIYKTYRIIKGIHYVNDMVIVKWCQSPISFTYKTCPTSGCKSDNCTWFRSLTISWINYLTKGF